MTKEINPQEFEEILREFVGIDITKFYYIVDRVIVFEGGNQVMKPLTPNQGSEKEKVSEYRLEIDGNWDYWEKGQVVETSEVKESEDYKKFRARMAKFEDSLVPTSITNIEVSQNGEEAKLCLESGGMFLVKRDREMFVSLYRYKETKSLFESYHVEVDEETHKLTYFDNRINLS